MATRQRKRNMARDIQDEIEAKALEEWTPAQIFRHVEKKLAQEDRSDEMPSQRTIQRIVKEMEIRDATGIWGLSESEGEDTRLILDVLADVMLVTRGRKKTFTKAEARWIAKVRKAAPDAPGYRVWTLARLYMLYESRGMTDTSTLDNLLVFTPWKSPNHYHHYTNAVKQGWIEAPRLWDLVSMVGLGLPESNLTLLDQGVTPENLAHATELMPEPTKRIMEALQKAVQGNITDERLTEILRSGFEQMARLTEEIEIVKKLVDALGDIETEEGITLADAYAEAVERKTPPDRFAGQFVAALKKAMAENRRTPEFLEAVRGLTNMLDQRQKTSEEEANERSHNKEE